MRHLGLLCHMGYKLPWFIRRQTMLYIPTPSSVKIPIRPNMRHTIMSETVKYLSTFRQQAALIPKSVSSLPQAPSRPVAVGKTV